MTILIEVWYNSEPWTAHLSLFLLHTRAQQAVIRCLFTSPSTPRRSPCTQSMMIGQLSFRVLCRSYMTSHLTDWYTADYPAIKGSKQDEYEPYRAADVNAGKTSRQQLSPLHIMA